MGIKKLICEWEMDIKITEFGSDKTKNSKIKIWDESENFEITKAQANSYGVIVEKVE